jgi:PAS domain S-box-containing protein
MPFSLCQLQDLLSFVVYLFSFFFVIIKDPKALINRVYALVIFCLLIWIFGFICKDYSDNKAIAMLWINISSIGWIGFASPILWFFLIFTKKEQILKNRFFYFAIFLVPLILIYKQWTGNMVIDLIWTHEGWATIWANSIWTYSFYIYYFSFILIGIFLCFDFKQKTKIFYEKKQANIILYTSLISVFLGTIGDVIFPQIRAYIDIDLPSLEGTHVSLISVVGIVYAITKYKLMTITPTIASDDILATMTDSLVLLNENGKILAVNKATTDLLKYDEKEMLGRNFDEFLEKPPFGKLSQKDHTFNYRANYRSKQGEIIPVSFNSSLMKDALFDEVIGVVVCGHDMSKIDLLQKQLMESEKMAVIGQISASIAHEINNPLGIILGFAQALRKKTKQDDKFSMPLEFIEKETIKCKNVIQDLLTFSRKTKEAMYTHINVNKLIEEILPLIRAKINLLKINIKIVLEYNDNLPAVFVEKNKIQEIIINLANNAMAAMPKGGTITIRTSSSEREKNEMIKIVIEDTGEGMDKETQKHIFEPFFTTKDIGNGTGLGLSLCYDIIQQHKGSIEVKSKIGKGTKIFVTIPAGSL